MKKITVIALAVLLTLSFAACGKRNDTNTTTPTTETSVLPQMDPTMDTNIPDDKVNDNSTDMTDPTSSTGNTDASTTPADGASASSKSGDSMK